MAKIPKSGIANAQTIQASHITNIIEALDGTGSYEIVATGSFSGSGVFSGSFSGDGTNLTGVTAEWDGTHVGNAEITGSLYITDTTNIPLLIENTATSTAYLNFKGSTTTTEPYIGAAGNALVMYSGGNRNFYTIAGQTVINIDSNNHDFKVQGQTDANLLFADASSNRVGIGTNFPSFKLHVSESNAAAWVLIEDGSVTKTAGVRSKTTTQEWLAYVDGSDRYIIRDSTNGFNSIIINPNTPNSAIIANSTEVAVNELGHDLNFRVESDTNANMLFVDASTDRVGIGTDTPSNKLHVYDASAAVTANVESGGAQAVGLRIQNSFSNWYTFVDASVGNYVISSTTTNKFPFKITGSINTNDILVLNESELSINDNGANYDFRVESDTNTNMLFVDGGTNRVGIGKSAPNSVLDVNGDAIVTGSLDVTENITTTAGFFYGARVDSSGIDNELTLFGSQSIQLSVTDNGLTGGQINTKKGHLTIQDGYAAKRVNINNGSVLTSNLLSQSFHPGDTLVVKMSTDTNAISLDVDTPASWPAWSTNDANPQFTVVFDGTAWGAGASFTLTREGSEFWRGNIICADGTHTSLNTTSRSIRNNGDLTAVYRFTAVSAAAWHVDVIAKDSTLFSVS